MDTKEYDDKILQLLSGQSTYKNLDVDPTPILQRKMNTILLSLKQQDKTLSKPLQSSPLLKWNNSSTLWPSRNP